VVSTVNQSADKIPGDIALEQRRIFLKCAGKVAVTAPAVALLLSMESKRAEADATVGPSGLQLDTFASPPN